MRKKCFSLSRDDLRQKEAILKNGPGLPSMFEAINGFAYVQCAASGVQLLDIGQSAIMPALVVIRLGL